MKYILGMGLLSRYDLDAQALTIQSMDTASVAIPDSDGDQRQVFLSSIFERVQDVQFRAYLYLACAAFSMLLVGILSEQGTLLYFYRQPPVKKKKERYRQRTYILLTASKRTLAFSSDIVAF
jgi:hypothetical protein